MTGISAKEQTCKNCRHTFTENFCNRCGQKEAHRITIAHVLHDMVHVFFHADKGIISFIPKLVLYPGIVAREFIDGKRKIFNPFQYFIISIGVILYLLLHAHFYESLQNYNNQNVSQLPAYFKQATSDFDAFVQKYGNIITFMAPPVYALFSWLLFRAKQNNYAEHFTIQVFIMSQVNTLNILFLLVCLVFKVTIFSTVGIFMLITACCFIITYKQFFDVAWPRAIWKGFIIYALSYLVQVIIMGMGLMVYALILRSRAHN